MNESELAQLVTLVSTEIKKLESKEQEMGDTEKMSFAKDSASFSHNGIERAEVHSYTLGTEFIKLQVQVATLLFIFMGFFVNTFVGDNSALNIFWVKIALVFGVLSLILSLIMGLLCLKLEEGFWDGVLAQRCLRFAKWIDVKKRKASFEEGLAYHDGTGMGKGNYISVPGWPWVMQTIFLGIGVTIIFTLFIAFVFVG